MVAEQTEQPRLDFTAFIMMLTMTGLYQLGKAAHPETGEVRRDLDQARQTIDLLSLLEEKTRNNLTTDEVDALRSGLTNLRLAYAEEVKASGPSVP
jgi:hypothetical protein